MGKLGDIGRKFLPWKITAAERVKNHVVNGTFPTLREVREFFRARRARILVGSAVATGAATATFWGVAGFAADGAEGKFNNHGSEAISRVFDGDFEGAGKAALEAGKTIRDAGEYAIDNPGEIPMAVMEEIGDEAVKHIRNLTATVGLIETGAQSAAMWRSARRQGGFNECFGSKTPDVIATAPPFAVALNKVPEGLSQNMPSKELPSNKLAEGIPQAIINKSALSPAPDRPPSTPSNTMQSVRVPTPAR